MTVINKLIMKSGPDVGKVYTVDKEEQLIGRELINDIIISDSEVSRKHAKISIKKDKIYLEDLGSTNGTFQSGKRVSKPVVLKNGDLINLGKSVVFEFVSEDIDMQVSVDKEEEQEGTKELQAKKPKESKPKKEPKKEKKPVKSGAPFGIKALEKTPRWVIIVVLVLLFLLVFCVIPLLIVDLTNQWCNLFGNFFNQIQPGVCP